MWKISLALLLGLALHAQGPVEALPRVPLEAGEGFAAGPFKSGDKLQGEAQREHPMGSLAKLVWLQCQGMEWAARDLRFNCTGSWEGIPCWNRSGHGKVNLEKAMRESCNLAFLSWARWSMKQWAEESGADSARIRLEEAFRPFLGDRMPQGEGELLLKQEWVGDGTLLRTSPAAMLQWLENPLQDGLQQQARRYLGNILQNPIGDWWMKTGTAPVPGDAGATSAWVVGGDGQGFAVLHLPRGRGKAEGLARFKAVVGIK